MIPVRAGPPCRQQFRAGFLTVPFPASVLADYAVVSNFQYFIAVPPINAERRWESAIGMCVRPNVIAFPYPSRPLTGGKSDPHIIRSGPYAFSAMSTNRSVSKYAAVR